MRLLFVTPAKPEPNPEQMRALAAHGVGVYSCAPAWLSPFTAMTIAKAAAKRLPDAVVVCRLSDAAAAMSALKLNPDLRYKIVMMPPANAAVPRGVPSEVAATVDAWALTSPLNKDKWATLLRGRDSRIFAIAKENPEKGNSPTPFAKAVWIGPINGNTSRLISAIKIIDRLEHTCTLAICGTGAARHTMPAVQASRAMQHPDRVVWLGEDFDLAAEAEASDAIIQAGPEPVSEELHYACGKQLLEPADEKFVIASSAPMPLENQAEEIIKIIES